MVKRPKYAATMTGRRRTDEKGKKTNTPKRLNSKCTNAMLTATSVVKREAISAVIVVPILAPIMKGNDFGKKTFTSSKSTTNIILHFPTKK